MKLLKILFPTLLILFALNAILGAQTFTKKYLMTFHVCGQNCFGVEDHKVYLAESDDGANWTLVQNFKPYNGSVPDLIIRGEKLYIYTPGKVMRYDKRTDTWDTEPVRVEMTDSNGNMVMFVDPSPILSDDGRIILFFLNSTGSTGDPAGCPTYPCTKYFDSAIEVEGSDGTRFILQEGHRKIVELTQAGQTASDPDIFKGNSNFILYISRGGSTLAFHSDSLLGEYLSFPNLTDDILTHSGGVPCGYFNCEKEEYWTYVHTNNEGKVVIRRAVHSGFDLQVENFTTVIDGNIIGNPNATAESPGFCLNKFILSGVEEKEIPLEFSLQQNYPNPFNPTTTIKYSVPGFISSKSIVKLEVYNPLGQKVATLVNKPQFPGNYSVTFNASDLVSGIYFYTLRVGNFVETKKMIVLY